MHLGQGASMGLLELSLQEGEVCMKIVIIQNHRSWPSHCKEQLQHGQRSVVFHAPHTGPCQQRRQRSRQGRPNTNILGKVYDGQLHDLAFCELLRVEGLIVLEPPQTALGQVLPKAHLAVQKLLRGGLQILMSCILGKDEEVVPSAPQLAAAELQEQA